MNINDISENINEAIEEHNIINIKYVDKTGIHTTRAIEPTEIKGDKLYGYCLVKGGIRCFFLNSILAVKPTDRKFTPRW